MLIAEEIAHPQWINDLLATVPWLIIFLFLWFFTYRALKRNNRRSKELRAAQERVAVLEQQLKQVSQGNESPNERR
jgi:hypothetical protein